MQVGPRPYYLIDTMTPGPLKRKFESCSKGLFYRIVPSQYAKDAKAAGLDIITWTLERSGRIVEDVLPTKGTAAPSYYYQTTLDALTNDGDIMTTLDVLAKQIGILGIFSDWSGTVSYYASCMGLN
ncbi:MAG: hypothetical protein K2Y35_13755 [Burkholderiales bacterium]|nr:hypothetical protein [Burkholderiales bacterium]